VQPVVLRSERLVLSAPTMDDVDAITQACQDPEVQAWTTVPSPYTRADAEEYIRDKVAAGWADGSACTWAIRLGEHAPVVGMVNCFGIADGGAEIGFWVAAEVRGRGVVSEAVNLVCDFGFAPDGLGLQRIQWHAKTGNVASAAVARRAGFQFEGTARLGGAQRGVRFDSWSAALLATDERRQTVGWPDETFARDARAGSDASGASDASSASGASGPQGA
jgi:RimJ/RimL family protein N-acetyltransferase